MYIYPTTALINIMYTENEFVLPYGRYYTRITSLLVSLQASMQPLI